MKEITFNDSIYKIFYPDIDMDDDVKKLAKTIVNKIFGNDSKLYFTDNEEVEVFIKPKEGETVEVTTPAVRAESNPDKPVELDPAVAARIAARKARANSGALPPGTTFG